MLLLYILKIPQKFKLDNNDSKEIHINDCPNYNSTNINIKDLVLENIKVDKKSYKYIISYYVGYEILDCIMPLQLFIKKIGFKENSDGYKYTILK